MTLASIGAERRCGIEHGPSSRNVGVCSSCRGAPASGIHALCEHGARRRDCCRECGQPLRSGPWTFASRVFADP